MKKITVDPLMLDQSAQKMHDEVVQYHQLVIQLFDEVQYLKNAWEGKDNQAFTRQIQSFENDFLKIKTLCLQYSEFLKTSAKAYRQMQDELYQQANSLSVGG